MSIKIVKDNIVLTNPEGKSISIPMKSAEECEKASFVVCAPLEWHDEPPFKASVTGTCSVCGKGIWYSTLTTPKTPPKICAYCAVNKLETAAAEITKTE